VNIEQLAKLIDRPGITVDPLPVTGRYPESKVTREIVKGALGLALSLGLVVGLGPGPWIAVPVLGVAVLFGLYLWQQVRRFSLRIQVDDTGVTLVKGDRREAFRWGDLKDFRLNYYANGRKATTGTLVVVLKAPPGRAKLDSTLDHFPSLLQRAAQAAQAQALNLHPTTQANLEQLGLLEPSK